MLRTRLCDLLGIQFPIFCAPMGFVTGPELAAAVSNAGGLGIMAGGAYPPPLLGHEIRRLRSFTSKPFGVNLLVQRPKLAAQNFEANLTVCLEERVPLISFYSGDPSRFVERVHASGSKVVEQVESVASARRAAQAGVDVIIAQGFEAGGHVDGTVTTMALVPRVVDAVAPTPVVAAGGMADARGVVAALALGAEGVVLGTRFLATPESAAHPLYKQKVLEASEAETVRTTLFGHGWPNAPHRVIRTRFVNEWLEQEARGNQERPDEPIIGETVIAGQRVPILRFMGPPPSTGTTGDLEAMGFYAGQGVGLVHKIQPAADIVHELVEGVRQIIEQRLSGVVSA